MGALREFFGKYIYFTIFAVYLFSIYAARALHTSALPLGFALAALAGLLFVFAMVASGLVKNSRTRIIAYFVLVALSGLMYAGYSQRMLGSSVLDAFTGKDVDVVGKVSGFPRLSENGMSLFLDIYKIQSAELALEDKRPLGRVFVFIRGGRELPISYLYKLEAGGQLSVAREPRNRGDFSMQEYLLPFGVRHEMVMPAATFVDSAVPGGKASVMLLKLKRKLVESAEAMLKPPGRDIFLGLLIGDSAIYFPQELKDTFRIAGLTHLLVVSGSQVSLLFLLVSLLFLRVEQPLSLWGRALNIFKYSAIFGVILTYAVITGYEPSIRRAFVVIILVLLAHYLYYEVDSLNVLGQAGLILLAMHPLEAYSVSFQLTFSATIGLILAFKAFYPHVAGMHWLPRWALGILIGTGGAQFMVFPLLLRYFNQFTPMGLVSNLVAIPLASCTLILGVAFYALWWVPVLGGFIAWGVQNLCDGMLLWAKLMSGLPGASIYFVPISSLTALALIALVFMGFVMMGWGKTRMDRMLSLVFACAALLVVTSSARTYTTQLPCFRVLYTSSGAASAYIARDRSAVMFVSLPPSLDRQASLLTTSYWALVRNGARGVPVLAITGGEPVSGLWEELPFKPELVLPASGGELALKNAPCEIPRQLCGYATSDGALGMLGLWMQKNGSKTLVLIPALDELGARLDSVQLPAPQGERRILIVPGRDAAGAVSGIKGFLERSSISAVVMQGRGDVPEGLLMLADSVEFYSQAAKREMWFAANGVVKEY